MSAVTTYAERCMQPDEPAECTACGGTGTDAVLGGHDARGVPIPLPCEICEGASIVCPVDGAPLMFVRDNVSGGTYPSCYTCDWVGHP